MADYRLDPRGIKPGAETTVMTTTGGVAGWRAAAAPEYVVSVTNGVPYIMFDADGTPVTEG